MSIRALLADRTGPVISAHPDDSVADVVKLLVEKRIGAVPIIDGDAILGIFSERDVIRGLVDNGPQALNRPVRDVMTAPAITVGADMSVLGALSLMTKRRFRHLPVVDSDGGAGGAATGGAMIGFVSIGDLVKYRIDNIEKEAAALRDYITSA
jgi:CBS domain-containing protein